jgi:hypothetical protein
LKIEDLRKSLRSVILLAGIFKIDPPASGSVSLQLGERRTLSIQYSIISMHDLFDTSCLWFFNPER